MRSFKELKEIPREEMTRDELVYFENVCIEKRFKCKIRTPALTEDQIELLEQGFPVKPNYNPFMNEQSREHTEKIVDKLLGEEN